MQTKENELNETIANKREVFEWDYVVIQCGNKTKKIQSEKHKWHADKSDFLSYLEEEERGS